MISKNPYQNLDPYLEEFLQAIQEPQRTWNLFRMALQVARIDNSELQYENSLAQVNRIRKKIRKHLRSRSPYSIIEHTNKVMFQNLGYYGNKNNYYDPLNSLMDQVLVNRTGIPITLSILYREITEKLDLQTWNVGMPGHFLLGFRSSGRNLYLDAFNEGRILLPDDCRAMMINLFGEKLKFNMSFLSPLSNSSTLLRMLMNLKQIYQKREEPVKLLRVLNRRIPLLSNPLTEILERAMTLANLKKYRMALKDFQCFIESTPGKSIRQAVESRITRLKILIETE